MGVTPPATERREQLADFLRGRRAAVTPAQAGLPEGGRRRTPGLRREEVAQLAGVGVSWYTWLEQGRDVRPSPQVLDALARALRLDAAEHAHLYNLARVEAPLPAAGDYPRSAPEELCALVDALLPHAAYVTNPRADVLAWNRAAAVLLVDFATLPPERRNMLWLLFSDERLLDKPAMEQTARRTLARFRAEHARRIGDPGFAALVEELTTASPLFASWWPAHEVLAEQGGTKQAGPWRLHHLQTIPTSHPDLRLTLMAGADEPTRAALAAAVESGEPLAGDSRRD
jgi:transcriptional regulator with XRE-family HTH domain